MSDFESIAINWQSCLHDWQSCLSSSWVPLFSTSRPSCLLKSLIIPIPLVAKHYLESSTSSGLHLPNSIINAGIADDTLSDDEDTISVSSEECHADIIARDLALAPFHATIHDAITQLGGKVMVKLNWCSPNDGKILTSINEVKYI